jgi:serine/threonine protein kinase
MPATVISVGQPANDSERKAIKHLRDNLPNGYVILHNFEVRQGQQPPYEIDLAVIAPHAVFVIDVKGTRGRIEVYPPNWHPEHHAAFRSPLPKLRQHAKVIHSLICDAHPTRPELRGVYVHAVALLTADDAKLIDPYNKDINEVTDLKGCVAYLQNRAIVPPNKSSIIAPLYPLIRSALDAKARPKSAPPRYRDWQIEEKLSSTERYTEYRARNVVVGKKGVNARLRVYKVDPYKPENERETENRLISNSFRALSALPGHPNIVSVKEFFHTEAEDQFILVAEDAIGQSLSQHIKKQSLTFDQKLAVIRGVLSALEHAHSHQVVHRNLTPAAILLGADGQPRLTGFDFARSSQNSSSTIASQIVEELDPAYQAPECFREPGMASPGSDLFSSGLIFYELLTGAKPFATPEQVVDRSAVFEQKPSELRNDLPVKLDDWLQQLCAFNREDRYASAAQAAQELERALTTAEAKSDEPITPPAQVTAPDAAIDYKNLPEDFPLNNRFIVLEKLGEGGFGVVYRVFETLASETLVMKIVTSDKTSVRERLKKEYVTLRKLSANPHPHVVKVIWADFFPDQTPYLLFDYVKGISLDKCLEEKSLSLEETVKLIREAASGLAHLHQLGIYHHDIKPSNLIWTEREGIKIIDFNVAAFADEERIGAGTRRYMPPDLRISDEAAPGERADHDLYALGLTFFQCVTGQYPFNEATPPPRQAAPDPRDFVGDLSSELAQLMRKMIAPQRSERFTSAEKLIAAVDTLKGRYRKPPVPAPITTETFVESYLQEGKPNFNPFVSELLKLYSQSKRSNAGTRGLDKYGEKTYVPTLLDDELRPAALNGEFKLVIISGNAGDGKTAFIQQMEKAAVEDGAQIERGHNGAAFTLRGRKFYSNYDGSQDEGEKVNDEVLHEFLAPFAGEDETQWPNSETRLIAINEGRLIDFLNANENRFPRLKEMVNAGLRGGEPANGVAIINLNLRAVVANREDGTLSIFDRLIQAFTKPKFWQPCQSCDLKDNCFIHHNAQTFMDPVAGPKVTERLKMLHTITHLRGRLHITLRDLRSALAFMLAGTRDCDGVHELYRSGKARDRQAILDGFYFNAWMGGEQASADRLVSLLREIDVGEVSNPDLDRALDFLAPEELKTSHFSFAERGNYDNELLRVLFDHLSRGYVKEDDARAAFREHREYVAMLRRRHFFEQREDKWKEMLPYRSADRFIRLVTGKEDISVESRRLVLAINRGEGITQPDLLDRALALRVREVKGGTIRSYRLFDEDKFTLTWRDEAERSRFIEHLPQVLVLRYGPNTVAGDQRAELVVNLDVYEMLEKLNEGYRPSQEERQGLYLRLAVFKNMLAAAPYQEVLLTETGHEFYRISRAESGVLTLAKLDVKLESSAERRTA